MANEIATDAKTLGETNAGWGQNHILTVSGGRLYTAYIDNTSDLVVLYSDNYGVDWTIDTTITDSRVSDEFTMCKSEDNDIFISYVMSGYDIIIKKRAYDTGTWSTVLTETVTAKPTVFLTYSTYNNSLYVFWGGRNASNQYGSFNKVSSDKGATWGSINIKSIGVSSSNPVTACGLDYRNDNGYLYFLYHSTNPRTYLCEYYPSGSWKQYIYASTSLEIYSGAVVVDIDNHYYMAYYYLSGGDYHLKVDRDGINILDINYSTTDAIKRGMISLGTDGDGNTYLFYVKESDSKCYYRIYDGSSWGSETVLTSGQGQRAISEQHSLASSSKLNMIFYTD